MLRVLMLDSLTTCVFIILGWFQKEYTRLLQMKGFMKNPNFTPLEKYLMDNNWTNSISQIGCTNFAQIQAFGIREFWVLIGGP